MLRDVPRIYVMFFVFLLIVVSLTTWFAKNYSSGSDTLSLNDALLTASVSEVDQTSRLYQGALLLNESFEKTVWGKINGKYPEGSNIQFDYLFNDKDTRFDNVESEKVSSPTYKIGTDTPKPEDATYMTGRPIKAVRIKVKKPNEKLNEWTYTSTVAVDAKSEVK